jgi:hypothetical protein
MRERLLELVAKWRSDPEYRSGREPFCLNECADELEEILEIPEHEFNEPPGQPLPDAILEFHEPVAVPMHPSVDEIMALLSRDDLRVQILPNGEVTAVAGPKVITMREALGGEYAH